MRFFNLFVFYFIFILTFFFNIRVHGDEYVHTNFGSSGTTAVQALSFSATPVSGSFGVIYTDDLGPHIFQGLAYNSTSSTIQTKLRLYSALATASVAGTIASNTITVTFTGVDGAVPLLESYANILTASGGTAVTLSASNTTVGVPTSQPTTSHWVELTPSLGYATKTLTAYNSTNSVLLLGTGAKGSESGVAILFPSTALEYNAVLANAARISVKTVSGTPTSGFLDVNYERNY